MTDGFWVVMQYVGAGMVVVALGYALVHVLIGGVEYVAARVVRERTGGFGDRVEAIAHVVNRNAEQHNKLAELVETAVSDVREAVEEERTHLIAAATEREKAHLAGVKGHLDQVKADVKRIEGLVAGMPATSWVRRIEETVSRVHQHLGYWHQHASVAVVVNRNEAQQNADRLRIEKLEAQLATLEQEMRNGFEKVGEDITAILAVVRPPEPAKPRRRKRAS